LGIGAWDLIWHLTLDIGILFEIKITLGDIFAFYGNYFMLLKKNNL
jgi:hypothetical protein